MRIYELAKELEMNSKDLAQLVEKELGIKVKNHMSSLTDLEVLRFKKALSILNNSKKTKVTKTGKQAIVDDEPLIENYLDNIKIKQFGRGCFIIEDPEEADIEAAKKGLDECGLLLSNGEYDLIILDEINIAPIMNMPREQRQATLPRPATVWQLPPKKTGRSL
jgi:hypothetical protein